jgi:hypothetical protein
MSTISQYKYRKNKLPLTGRKLHPKTNIKGKVSYINGKKAN